MQAVAQFGEADEAKLQLLVRWTMALPFLLKAHLSGSPFAEHLQVTLLLYSFRAAQSRMITNLKLSSLDTHTGWLSCCLVDHVLAVLNGTGIMLPAFK